MRKRKPARSKATRGSSSSKRASRGDGRWPIEREILWRPHRFAYLQGQAGDRDKAQVKASGEPACVFCDARARGLSPESLVIYDNGTTMVVLNKFPYNNGHLLVLPVRHAGDIIDLSEDEYVDLHKLVKKSVSALRKAYGKVPPGMNLGANLGAAAGAGIPQHLHFHIIPRWIGDSNFFPLVGQTKVISETLEQTYQRLLPYFE